jgi:hypothetical protein
MVEEADEDEVSETEIRLGSFESWCGANHLNRQPQNLILTGTLFIVCQSNLFSTSISYKLLISLHYTFMGFAKC